MKKIKLTVGSGGLNLALKIYGLDSIISFGCFYTPGEVFQLEFEARRRFPIDGIFLQSLKPTVNAKVQPKKDLSECPDNWILVNLTIQIS